MVRLEKILTEKIFNTKTLGRARAIELPRKFDHRDQITLGRSPWMNTLVRILPNSFKISFSSWRYKGSRWNGVIRGLSFDDYALQNEDQLRRGVIWEHIVRENMHPYHYMVTILRRGAWSKVDFGVDGFEAQEEIQQDAKNRYWLKVRPNIMEWHKIYGSYMSDEVPQTFFGNGTFVGLLDMTLLYNFFRKMTWNRFFINENNLSGTKEYYEEAFPAWCTTVGKLDEKKFTNYIQELNDRFPGLFAPDGQRVDMDQFFQDEFAHPDFYDENGVDILGTRAFTRNVLNMPESFKNAETEPEQIDTPNVVGTRIPDAFKHERGTSLM